MRFGEVFKEMWEKRTIPLGTWFQVKDQVVYPHLPTWMLTSIVSIEEVTNYLHQFKKQVVELLPEEIIPQFNELILKLEFQIEQRKCNSIGPYGQTGYCSHDTEVEPCLNMNILKQFDDEKKEGKR